MEDNEKRCSKCANYGHQINLGRWWCNAGHTDNMNAETCEDYNENSQFSSFLSSVVPNIIYKDVTKGNMAKYKVDRAKKKRKKEKGIKHGRR